MVFVLVPAGAHLLEMSNKLALAPEHYMIAQRSYDGWWRIGLVIPVALVLVAVRTVLCWRRGEPWGASLVAWLLLAAAHAIFWTFTFPANRVTENWTRMPADFERVRLQWEWSHAVGACLDLAALVVLLVAVLFRGTRPFRTATSSPGP